jgi:hypothetical protein
MAISTVEKLLASGTITKAHAKALLAGIENEFRTVTKQMEQDRTPADEIEERIALLRQASPSLTRDQAQSRVFQEHPDLYERHVQAMRAGKGSPSTGVALHGPPSEAAPLTVKSILKMADEQVAKTAGLTKRALLATWVQEHPREVVYLNAYRAFHHGQGLDEHHGGGAERERTMYDRMHH